MKTCARALLAAIPWTMMLATTAGLASEGPARIAGGSFRSVLPLTETGDEITLASFALDRRPITNGEFLGFVTGRPAWRRGSVASVFADESYLAHWKGPLEPGIAAAFDRPVTNVSWFAAHAYCESVGGRLPSWHEWEYVAAADENETDAREDPAWRQQILSWYGATGGKTLSPVGVRAPNVWGIHDMHGLVWEWVDDFNALLIASDNREQGGADKLQFCGAGAATMEEKENYAVLMRTAMLSSLQGADTTRNLGFRCAYDVQGE
jgi:formylglycine-generating enzyme required for sulfatase activity